MDGQRSSKILNLLPFGIPTLIIAEDPQLLAAAAAAYAHWLAEAPVTNPSIEVRLEIGSASSADVCLQIVVEGSRLKLSGAGAIGTADSVSGKAGATITSALASDVTNFAEVIDTLLLFILARRGRTPVHASAFMIGDLAVALAGSSGSGKSTLALAATSRGLPVLSDDMIFVQREPFAVWGFPRPIHVFAEDAPPGDHSTRLRSGKTKAAIPLATPALKAERTILVLLERGRELALRRIESSDAVNELMNLDAGFDLLEQDSRDAIEALATNGAWRLTLSDDPRSAVDLLMSRFTA
jgi:hypothetical protein